MNNIDQRVVQMQFDNKQFESGVKESLGTINDLKKGLDLTQAGQHLDNLYKKGKAFSLQGIADGVDSLNQRFSTMGIVGMSVINNLTSAAMQGAKKIAGFMLTPLIEGGLKRAEAIEQAKFQFEGLGMDVEKTMESALAAVKGTAYGLGDAALVAAQLGASGMKAGEAMTAALRGTAGVAAMTKSEYSDIGRIFTTVAGNGRLMGDQLNQLSSRGINAAATVAKYLGVTEGKVREMVSDGQISFETFSLAMDDAFGSHAQDANKLFSGALANMQAALARIGAEFQTVKLDSFRDMLNALTPVIDMVHEKMMPLIDLINEFQVAIAHTVVTKLTWFEDFNKKFKFVDRIVEALRVNIITLKIIFETIGKAFRSAFPKASTYDLITLSHAFLDLSEYLMVLASPEVLGKIYKVFKGFFSVIRFGVDIVFTLAQCIFGLAKGLIPLGGLLLNIASGFGAFISGITTAITSADIFSDTVKSCNTLGNALSSLFEHIKDIVPFFFNLAKGVSKVFEGMFGGITKGINGLDIEKLVKLINGILFGVILKNLGDLINNLAFLSKRGLGLDGIIGVFDKLKATLTLYQGQLKGATLMKIAIAVGILALSLVMLASIDSDKLMGAIAAMGALFVQLGLAFKVFEGLSFGFKALVVIPPLLIGMATAIFILATSVKLLSTIDWPGIIKGLVAISGLMGILVAATKLLSKSGKGLATTGVGLVLFAAAIHILAGALKKIGELSVATIAKGLAGIALLMTELVIFNKFVKNNLTVKSSIALIFLGTALNILGEAVRRFGEISVKNLAKGLGAIAVVLYELLLFMKLAGRSSQIVTTAIAMNILGAALYILAGAIDKMGGMSVGELAKGLIGLGIALGIIAVAMKFMAGALPGAAALLVVAGALAIFVPLLKILGGMSLKEVATSLGMLAGVFAVLGLAALVLTPLIPALLGLGAALTLIGLGCALAGAGLVAVSIGITALAAAGVAGAAGLTAMVAALIGLIPLMLQKTAEGIVAFCDVIAVSGKSITAAITTILMSILNSITMIAPKLISTVMLLLTNLIKALVVAVPMFVRAGFALLLGVLRGIRDNIGQVVTTAVEIVVNFINALAANLPKIVQAGFNFVIAFINGLANGIRKNNKRVIKAVDNLLSAFIDAAKEWVIAGAKKIEQIGKDIVQGMINGVKAKIDKIGSIAKTLGAALLKGIKKFLGINSPSKKMEEVGMYSVAGLAKGLKKYAGNAVSEAKNVGGKTVDAMSKAIAKVSDISGQDLSLAPTIRPVVDLDEVTSARKTIESTLGASATINTALAAQRARSISRPQSSAEKVVEKTAAMGESFSFVQNNYSPKALSRLEIYRQTKNQLSAVKG